MKQKKKLNELPKLAFIFKRKFSQKKSQLNDAFDVCTGQLQIMCVWM